MNGAILGALASMGNNSIFSKTKDLLFGAGSEFINKGIDTQYQMQLNRQQNDLAKELWEYQQSNANQLKMQDMKNAGINPMAEFMTASGGTSGASAPATAPLSSAGGTSKLSTELLKTLKAIQYKL